MREMKVITLEESKEWMSVLERCAPYDFYHLPEYHLLAENQGEGKAYLFIYTEDNYTIALPLLLRELNFDSESIDSDEFGCRDWKDATSVYGYPGPLCSDLQLPDTVTSNFRDALFETLRKRRVVTVFSRLNPFFTQRTLLEGLGDFRQSQTVAIDLTIGRQQQWSQYRRAFKAGIKKLKSNGVTVEHDIDGRYLDQFVKIYHETMLRVGAEDRYFFTASYLRQLWEKLQSRIHLFVCLNQGQLICAGLFGVCHGIIQFHLGATPNHALELAPMKLLVDEVSLWGMNQGYRYLYLGGGKSAKVNDSLLHFKMGFSDHTLDFETWRWILSPQKYEVLCQARKQLTGQQTRHSDFFPAYRAPFATDSSVAMEPV